MRSAALVDGMHGGLMVKPCWQLCLFLKALTVPKTQIPGTS